MYKQIIIVRKDLNMTHGKMATQVSHASMAFLTNMIKEHVIGDIFDKNMNPINKYRVENFDIDKGLYDEWINNIFTKVVLQTRNKTQLLKAKTMAEELGMKEGEDFFLIKDNCYTELTPEETDENGVGRTLTCIGFKPMDTEKIDQIGKKFQIYRD